MTAPAPPAIYTLSLHDALPISATIAAARPGAAVVPTLQEIAAGRHLSTLAFSEAGSRSHFWAPIDRKSTRLNSSHTVISYAVFCLKKKKKKNKHKDTENTQEVL